jgi:hypothetical protein
MKMDPIHARRGIAGLYAAVVVALAGCGGGGGDGPGTPAFAPSASLANMCTLDEQKSFVRSYLDEVYLWYDEIPTVNPAPFKTIASYFDALLVKTLDAAGLPKDRFSAALPVAVADAQMSAAFGQPSSALPGKALAANGQSVAATRVFTTPAGRKTGYVLFLDHHEGAQDELISAFQTLREQQVADLVLDLRYNSGGFLYVALAAASLVAGPSAEGQVFEQLRYNRKRATDSSNSFVLFSGRVQFGETVYPRGTILPQLGLPRLYVLTTGMTCSSSESIINGLRGIGVEVILVGQTTCGKPYGFQRKDNCGTAFFPVEFQGFNARGFGDYTAGFAPTCRVAPDGSTPLGSPDEPLLAAAITHIDSGSCPAGTATGAKRAGDAAVDAAIERRPPWAGRLLRTDPQGSR